MIAVFLKEEELNLLTFLVKDEFLIVNTWEDLYNANEGKDITGVIYSNDWFSGLKEEVHCAFGWLNHHRSDLFKEYIPIPII